MPGINVKQLEMTVINLEAQLNMRTEQVKKLDDYIAKAAKETQTIIDSCREFCMKILETDIVQGTVSSNDLKAMSLSELMDKTVQEYNNKQENNRKIYDIFTKKLQEKNEIINGLQTQVSQLQIRVSQEVEQRGDGYLPDPKKENPDLQRQTAYLIDTPKENISEIQPAINQNNEISEKSNVIVDFAKSVVKESKVLKQTAQSTKKPMLVDYETYKSQMTDLMWLIIRLMGEEGLCEFPEIKLRCFEESKDQKIKISTVNSALSSLKNMKAISQGIKVNTGIRWFYVYELEELGHRLYVDRYKKPPVESEIKKLIREHDNIKHGYYIKEAKGILKDKYDYQSVSTSRKANYIKLPNGKASIPDVVCAKNGQVDYYEVECGNHPQSEFNDKCDKLNMLSSNIRFIVPDNDTLNRKLIPQIENWIQYAGGIQALKKTNTIVYITTLKKLLDKEWLVVYNMEQEQPVYLTKEGVRQ